MTETNSSKSIPPPVPPDRDPDADGATDPGLVAVSPTPEEAKAASSRPRLYTPFSKANTLPGSMSAMTGVRPAGTVIGSYKIIELLGEGGMGHVFLAEHTRLGRKVALKLLRSEYASNATAVRRFFTEACAVNQICHENIVEITDFIENEGGDSYCIMELLRGKTLQEMMKEEGALPIHRALGIAVQMARALAAVHDAGIVHRDLKPANVFLTGHAGQQDFVKLLDFGIAKLSDEVPNVSSGQTTPGAILGTPEYMSAEQASGKVASYRADLYSLGVILYEMVTGRKPHTGKSLGELVIKHLTVVPVRPTKVKGVQKIPKELDDLIMQCLEKEPSNRPRDMSEVADRLKRIASEESVELETFAARRQPRFTRRDWMAAGAVGVMLLAGIPIALFLRSPEPPPQIVAAPGPRLEVPAPRMHKDTKEAEAPRVLENKRPPKDPQPVQENRVSEPPRPDAAVASDSEPRTSPKGVAKNQKPFTKRKTKKVEGKIFGGTVDPFREKPQPIKRR